MRIRIFQEEGKEKGLDRTDRTDWVMIRGNNSYSVLSRPHDLRKLVGGSESSVDVGWSQLENECLLRRVPYSNLRELCQQISTSIRVLGAVQENTAKSFIFWAFKARGVVDGRYLREEISRESTPTAKPQGE